MHTIPRHPASPQFLDAAARAHPQAIAPTELAQALADAQVQGGEWIAPDWWRYDQPWPWIAVGGAILLCHQSENLWHAVQAARQLPRNAEIDARYQLREGKLLTKVGRTLSPIAYLVALQTASVASERSGREEAPAAWFMRGAPLQAVGTLDKCKAIVLDVMQCAIGAPYEDLPALHAEFRPQDAQKTKVAHALCQRTIGGKLVTLAGLAGSVHEARELDVHCYYFPYGAFTCTVVIDWVGDRDFSVTFRLHPRSPIGRDGLLKEGGRLGRGPLGHSFRREPIRVSAEKYQRPMWA